jgi:hypothetical protein
MIGYWCVRDRRTLNSQAKHQHERPPPPSPHPAPPPPKDVQINNKHHSVAHTHDVQTETLERVAAT